LKISMYAIITKKQMHMARPM